MHVKRNSALSKRLSQHSNSVAITHINDIARSESTQYHSMIEWPTFGSTKEEDELMQLWRQAYAVVTDDVNNSTSA